MFYISIQLGLSSSQLTFIFFRGVGLNHQPAMDPLGVHLWIVAIRSSATKRCTKLPLVLRRMVELWPIWWRLLRKLVNSWRLCIYIYIKYIYIYIKYIYIIYIYILNISLNIQIIVITTCYYYIIIVVILSYTYIEVYIYGCHSIYSTIFYGSDLEI